MSHRNTPRFVPDRPLPPYSYVSGHYPHPIRDQDGHMAGAEQAAPSAPDPQRWRDCETYLYGVDLFNNGYYWEAHETWEQLWHACGRTGTLADFFKGLIKLAAAGVKARERRPNGVQRHARRAAELLRLVARDLNAETARLMGLDVNQLAAVAEQLGRNWTEVPAPDRLPPVEVLFDERLLPQ